MIKDELAGLVPASLLRPAGRKRKGDFLKFTFRKSPFFYASVGL